MYQRILVLLDGSRSAERGLGWARQLARGPDGSLHLLMIEHPGRVIRDGSRVIAFADQVEDAARASATAYLEGVATRLREDGLSVATHVRIGNTIPVIRTVIEEAMAHLVVFTPSGATGLARDFLRRSVPVPVLVAGSRCQRSA